MKFVEKKIEFIGSIINFNKMIQNTLMLYQTCVSYYTFDKNAYIPSKILNMVSK